MQLSEVLGADLKTEKKMNRIMEAHTIITKRLEEKEVFDFNNFILNEEKNMPEYVVAHFRSTLQAFADCDKFKIPKMKRTAQNRVIEAIKIDLKKITELWIPFPSLKLFTLLHETELMIATYLGVDTKFCKKYMEEIGKGKGVSPEIVREKSKELSRVEVELSIDHEVVYSDDIMKKFNDVINHLSSSSVKIIKYNDTFIDYEKLSKNIDEDLSSFRKNIVFEKTDLPEWLNKELFFNAELRVREIAMQKFLIESVDVFEKNIITMIRGCLTRLDKIINFHKNLAINGSANF